MNERDIESSDGVAAPGAVVVTYALDFGFDTVGRGGTITAGGVTSDGQLAIEVSCVIEDCTDFVPVNDFRQASIVVTARSTDEVLVSGEHAVPFVLRFDDGVEHAFDVVLWAGEEPSAGFADEVAMSTGPPTLVQRVFTDGNFAFHAVSAFDSIWVLNNASRTVSRIDAVTGAVQATISISDATAAASATRLTATDDAIFVTGRPAVRIDAATNEVSSIDGEVASMAVIADGDTVWAASLGGPIVRIDDDGNTIDLNLQGRWVDLAVSSGLVWAVESVRGGGRLIAFNGDTGDLVHELAIATDVNGYAVRLVADDSAVVVGVDTSGGVGRTGQLIVVDPNSASVIDTVELQSRPEGIVVTPNYIWTSGAVLDRSTMQIVNADGFGFTITRGPDGSIWGASVVPGSQGNNAVINRYAPGGYAG